MDEELKQIFTDMTVRVQAPALDLVVARSDKIQRMALGLRKSHRVKDFKHAKDSNIREYIKVLMQRLALSKLW